MELFNVYSLYDVTLERGCGARVYDDKDREYLDFYCGGGMVPVGHNHSHYLDSMTSQMRKLPYYSNCVKNPLQTELAQKLGRASHYDDYSLFLTNSSEEAKDCILRLASSSSRRVKTLKFSATQLTSIDENLGLKVERREMGDELLVVDETETGFGRTGQFFAHQWYGIRPDIIIIGGAMGNGFPVGGLLISPEIKPSIGMLRSMFGGNYMASTAAIATVDILHEAQLTDNVRTLGDYLINSLRYLQTEFSEKILNVRGRGCLVEIAFAEHIADLRRELLYRQFVFTGVADANTLRLLPPYIITEDDIDEFVNKLRNVLI